MCKTEGMETDRERTAPRVAIVVVSYGSDAVLPAFLASVPGASRAPLDTVVADNRPADGTVERLSRDAGAHYLPLENRGYGAAINAAEATIADDVEWLLISNPDVTLGAGAVDLLLDAVDDERIAAVGPRIVDESGVVYPSARSIPSLRSGVGHALFVRIWPGNPWTRTYRRDDASPVRRDTGWLSGACLLVRRSAFRELGGFDDEFFMYFEDVDFGFRLGRARYRSVYEPAAVVVHTGAHSTENSAEMVRVHHLSAARFIGRKYPGPILFPLRAVLRLGLRVRSALMTRER